MKLEISDFIKSDAVNKTINPEKQSRHILGSNGYIPGRSYLFDSVDAQELVDKYHGTGRAEISRMGMWKNVENVTADRNIGVRIDPKTGEETPTNRFTIHYSKTGTHVVPAKPDDIRSWFNEVMDV